MKLLVGLLFVGLIAAMILWWRALHRHRADFIENYPYAKFLDARLAARRPELSAAQRKLVFEALRDPAMFATASQHPIMRTAAWANGADLAPEFLLELMRAQRGERAA